MTSPVKASNTSSRNVVLATTLILGVGSIGLIFAPEEIASALGIGNPASIAVVLQLYGAALFGLAMTGWMVKGAVIGGVFGRSYVVGNTGHALVGAMALTRPVLAPGASPALWAAALVYWALALVFGYLMFVAAP